MTLSVSRLVRVIVNLSPLAAARRSFGILLVAGDSNVINGLERIRSYETIEGVATDFQTTDPEYLAAALYFGQTPKPKTINIGRWLRTASSGINIGSVLTATQQTIATWNAITSGGFKVTVDGVLRSPASLNFSAAANLNAVAAIIDAALTGASCTWTGTHFLITSDTTGTSSLVTAVTSPVSGTDISTMLRMTASTLASLVPGYAAESPVACATALATFSTAWYGLMFGASVMPTDDQSIAVSDFIEALDIKRNYGVTIQNTNILSAAVTDDLASRMKAGGYKQSWCQFSTSSAYAVASFFGRAFSVDFNANRSTITLMYKQEPGITAEDLDENEAGVLKDKRCNVFASYINDTAIIQYGVMSGSAYFDEIHGLDWFQDAVQNTCYNLLYTSKTKIPQTDAGANQFTSAIAGVCDEAVNNGLVAPGTWLADGFGQLEYGQYLKEGYYIFTQSMALQSQSDRDARIAPPIQVAIKLAGAIQELDVLVNVNR